MIRQQTGKQAIPSMGVLTIKLDGHGNPDHAKSCIVVLGNHETTQWSKSDCFTPIVSAPVIHLMAALAIKIALFSNKATVRTHSVTPAFFLKTKSEFLDLLPIVQFQNPTLTGD